MLWLYDFMEKFPIFYHLIPTPDFPYFYYMLGANLGLLLYGDVSVMFNHRLRIQSALGISRWKMNPTRILVSPVSVLKFQVAMSGVQQPSLIENLDIFLAFHDSRNNLNKRSREYATSLHMLSTAMAAH